MNFVRNCQDVVSGKTGSFGFDTDEYLTADKPMQYKALTPVFDTFPELEAWAKKEGVFLSWIPLNWRNARV